MRSTRAGPSRARNTRKSASPYARAAAANGHSAEELSESDMEIDGDPSQTQGAGARSRPRHSLRAQVFEVPDAGEKARIGDGYRELQRDADDMRTNLENINAEDLKNALEQQNHLFKSVRDTTTASLDARLMMTMTETAANLVRKMKLGGPSFEVDEFLSNLRTILGLDRPDNDDLDPVEEDEGEGEGDDDDELRSENDMPKREGHAGAGAGPGRARRGRRGALGNWERIGWIAVAYSRRVPGVEFLHGPLAVRHQKRTMARRAPRQEIAALRRAEEIQTQPGSGADGGTKDITVSNVREVLKALERLDPRGKGVNLFTLFINPDNFPQSVENLFYISFLIREGRVGVEVEDDGMILVRKTRPAHEVTDGEIQRHQHIIEFSIQVWEQAKAVFGITESAIPTRAKDPGAAGAVFTGEALG